MGANILWEGEMVLCGKSVAPIHDQALYGTLSDLSFFSDLKPN